MFCFSISRVSVFAGAIILGLAGGGAAVAQAPAAKSGGAPPEGDTAALPAEPNVTTASYGDWVLRCQRAVEAGKVIRLCEVAEIIQVQGQTAPVAQIAIGRPARGEPWRITAVLPPAVAFPSTVKVGHEKDGTITELDWRRCLPGGCFADAHVKDDGLKRLRGLTGTGTLTFKDATGRDVALSLSFRGLAQALDGLAKEGG